MNALVLATTTLRKLMIGLRPSSRVKQCSSLKSPSWLYFTQSDFSGFAHLSIYGTGTLVVVTVASPSYVLNVLAGAEISQR